MTLSRQEQEEFVRWIEYHLQGFENDQNPHILATYLAESIKRQASKQLLISILSNFVNDKAESFVDLIREHLENHDFSIPSEQVFKAPPPTPKKVEPARPKIKVEEVRLPHIQPQVEILKESKTESSSSKSKSKDSKSKSHSSKSRHSSKSDDHKSHKSKKEDKKSKKSTKKSQKSKSQKSSRNKDSDDSYDSYDSDYSYYYSYYDSYYSDYDEPIKPKSSKKERSTKDHKTKSTRNSTRREADKYSKPLRPVKKETDEYSKPLRPVKKETDEYGKPLRPVKKETDEYSKPLRPVKKETDERKPKIKKEIQQNEPSTESIEPKLINKSQNSLNTDKFIPANKPSPIPLQQENPYIIVVCGLQDQYNTIGHILKEFNRFGLILAIQTVLPKKYALIQYAELEAAFRAVNSTHTFFKNVTVKVDYAFDPDPELLQALNEKKQLKIKQRELMQIQKREQQEAEASKQTNDVEETLKEEIDKEQEILLQALATRIAEYEQLPKSEKKDKLKKEIGELGQLLDYL